MNQSAHPNGKAQAYSVSHHLADETLIDYASGALTQAMETLVACHLTVCRHCRERNQFADEMGGLLLASNEPVMPRASAQELLTRARQKPNITVSEKPAAIGDASVPRPLGRLLPGPLESLDWSAIAPGVKQFDLGHRPRKEGAFKLLRLEPGVALTPHSHNERELTYVVRGSYTDEIGQFCAGDIADLDECDEHCPIVDEHEVCYAVVATDAPVRYSTMLGKIMQPFVGI